MIRGLISYTLPCILSSHFKLKIPCVLSVLEEHSCANPNGKVLQYSEFSAKSPLKSEMVQSVPGTTPSNGRCVEPWEFKVSLHTLGPIELVWDVDNQCFLSKQLHSNIFLGVKNCSLLTSRIDLPAATLTTDHRGKLQSDFEVGFFPLHTNIFSPGLSSAQEVCLWGSIPSWAAQGSTVVLGGKR